MAKDILEILHIIETQYPDALPILKQPGVFQVYADYINAEPPWTQAQFDARMRATEYYQTTDESTRNFHLLHALDPAEARRRTTDTDKLVRQIAGEMGIPPNAIDALFVLNAVGSKWDESRIRMELVARTSGDTRLGPGGIGDQMNQYKKLAGDYGVPVTNQDLYWWAANTQGGTVSEAGFRDFVTQQAKNLFPALAPAIDQGQTVMQFATPYFAMATEELGINPNQINLLNPKWMELFVNDDGKGTQTVNSLQSAKIKLRADPAFGYDKGTPAITQAAGFAEELMKKFGAVA
jgi:hypothetical protein